jgi:hypothetical protein
MPNQTILKTIQPVIFRIYGDDGRSMALAKHLAEQLPMWETSLRYEARENMILHTCWNWFPGGGTAAIAARDIEAALNDEYRSG